MNENVALNMWSIAFNPRDSETYPFQDPDIKHHWGELISALQILCTKYCLHIDFTETSILYFIAAQVYIELHFFLHSLFADF